MFWIAVSLAMLAPSQAQSAPDAAGKVVESFIGESVVGVVRLDLDMLDAKALADQVAEIAGEREPVDRALAMVSPVLEALKASGAHEVNVMLDASAWPNPPIVVVPLAEGADAARIAQALKGHPPLATPATATIRGAVVGGTAEALAALQKAPAGVRAGYLDARKAGAGSPLSVAVVPNETLRRVLEESLPTLPKEAGGGPITALSRGVSWIAIRLDVGASPTLKMTVMASFDAATRSIWNALAVGLASAREALSVSPKTQELAAQLEKIQPTVEGSQVRLVADLGQITTLLSLPVQDARERALRSQCTNSMKQIGLAMHNFLSAKKTFPPAYTASKEGTPLLSWRVAILPYLDQKALYDEFHQDEPWDSPHNKALLSRMPDIYRCPNAKAGEGMTTYLVPRGPGTMFPGAEGVPIRDVFDGTSATIMVVDAGDANAVPWTKPEDWEIGEAPDVSALLGHHPGGFLCALADASALFFKETISVQTLRALLTRNGGEAIDFSKLRRD